VHLLAGWLLLSAGFCQQQLWPLFHYVLPITYSRLIGCNCVLAGWLLLRPYAGFCKQQLWPLFHYVLPMAPSSAGRFNSELWQAYVKANKVII
jgi:trehalose-6-phosphate synthase